MSTPYANIGIATAQIALSTTATKVGSGASGVPLAFRLLWRGLVNDTTVQAYLGPVSVTSATGYPMQTGIPEERAYGPGVDIYCILAAGTSTIYVEESAG